MGGMEKGRAFRVAEREDGDVDRLRIVAVGEGRVRSDRLNNGLEYDPDITFLGPDDLAGLVENLAPDIVLAPMIAASFDCIDIAQILSATNFRGRYRVMTPEMPNPGVLIHEIRSLCPGLNFDLVEWQRAIPRKA